MTVVLAGSAEGFSGLIGKGFAAVRIHGHRCDMWWCVLFVQGDRRSRQLQVPATAIPVTPAEQQNGSARKGKRVRFDGTQAPPASSIPATAAMPTSASTPVAQAQNGPGAAQPSADSSPAGTAGAREPAVDGVGTGKKKRKSRDNAGSTPAAKRPAE